MVGLTPGSEIGEKTNIFRFDASSTKKLLMLRVLKTALMILAFWIIPCGPALGAQAYSNCHTELKIPFLQCARSSVG